MKYDSDKQICEVEDGDELQQFWWMGTGTRIPVPEGYRPCREGFVLKDDLLLNPSAKPPVFEPPRPTEIGARASGFHLLIRKVNVTHEHQARHRELHRCFDELLADYITQTGKSIGNTTIMELIEWSGAQAKDITHPTVKA